MFKTTQRLPKCQRTAKIFQFFHARGSRSLIAQERQPFSVCQYGILRFCNYYDTPFVIETARKSKTALKSFF